MGACVSGAGPSHDPGAWFFLWRDGPPQEYSWDIDAMHVLFRDY